MPRYSISTSAAGIHTPSPISWRSGTFHFSYAAATATGRSRSGIAIAQPLRHIVVHAEMILVARDQRDREIILVADRIDARNHGRVIDGKGGGGAGIAGDGIDQADDAGIDQIASRGNIGEQRQGIRRDARDLRVTHGRILSFEGTAQPRHLIPAVRARENASRGNSVGNVEK